MKHLVWFLFFIFGALAQTSAGGVSGGGGGTSVVYSGQRVLLDLMMLPELREQVVRSQADFGDPFIAADQVLKKWDEKQLSFTSTAAGAAFQPGISWRLVRTEFKLSTRFYIPTDLVVGDPRTVAYYKKSGRKFAIQVSSLRLQEMNSLSQVATVVHETLRHLQIGWDKQSGAFDERSLQEATAIYVLCQPSNALGMYVNFILQNQRIEAEKLCGDLNNFVQEHCRAVVR